MKFTIEIDPEVNPDAVGEYLRSAFFNEMVTQKIGDHEYKETGCYSTFEWQEDVENLDPIQILDEVDGDSAPQPLFTWTRGKKLVGPVSPETNLCVEIECRWYWDGDGTLVFILPDGQYLVNTDCKKDHGWYLTEDPEDF
jgi:hypothetical protein